MDWFFEAINDCWQHANNQQEIGEMKDEFYKGYTQALSDMKRVGDKVNQRVLKDLKEAEQNDKSRML